jgi:hypothetical protein
VGNELLIDPSGSGPEDRAAFHVGRFSIPYNARMAKLTLRDLFAVVTIVALALGWWVDRSRLAQERELFKARAEAREYLERLGFINADDALVDLYLKKNPRP